MDLYYLIYLQESYSEDLFLQEKVSFPLVSNRVVHLAFQGNKGSSYRLVVISNRNT